MIKKYLIIGSSAGGVGCALRLRILDQHAKITVLTAENEYPYNKCLLADVLLGDRQSEDVVFCSPAVLAEKSINFIPNTTVYTIDESGHSVTATDGRTFSYDELCIATGRSPRMIPLFVGKKYNNLFNFYYKKNVDQIIEFVTSYKPQHAVVIGAGLTGLEAADGLRARGCSVTILETEAHVLPHLVNEIGARVIHEQIKAAGVQLFTHEMINGYESQDNKIRILKTKNNGMIAADLVVCTVGAQPNTDFLPESIKSVHGYCIVDDMLCTAVPDVYAVGDCCIVYDRLRKTAIPSSLWPDAMQQGMYAAYNMTGIHKLYAGTAQIAASGFFGIKVACAGSVQIHDACTFKEEYGQGWYHRFVYEQNVLVGFMLVGNTGDLSTYRRQIMTVT